MSDTNPDIEILETDLPPPPAGTPLWFRELVALTLKTTDPTVLDAAEQDYRGVFASADDFIHNQLAEHLPRHLQWLPACCDPAKLRAGYEREARARPTMAPAPSGAEGPGSRSP